MRNANGEVPGGPQRSPAVIYLSEVARVVLRWNREVRRLADAPPVLDAELVEFALANYESQRLGQATATAGQHSDGRFPLSADLDQAVFKALQNRVNELEQQVIKAATKLEDDKLEELRDQAELDLRDTLLAAHRYWQSWLLYPIAQRLSLALSSAEDDACSHASIA